MKKNLFVGFIALAALTVTSCTNDEVVEAIPQKQAIEFGTYLGRDAQSRGTVLGDINGTDFLDFGVFASYTHGAVWNGNAIPNFMFNQKVSRTKSDQGTFSAWSYSPLKYWPTTQENEFISFFAYAPYATADNCISVNADDKSLTGTPKITYTITADKLDKMADFTADVQMNETKTYAGANPDKSTRNVDFGFRHELTRVAIQAKLDRDAFDATDANKTKVNIKQIDFTGAGFATKATYQFANTSDTRGAWTYTAAATATPLEIIAGAAGSVLVNNNTLTNGKGNWLEKYKTAGYLLEDDDEEIIFGENNYLFLIPPTKAGITAVENAVSMIVYYDIVTADAALDNGYSISSAVKQIDLPTNAGLLTQGAAYKFTLTFNLNGVTFSAKVEDWPTEGNHDANVDYPKTDK